MPIIRKFAFFDTAAGAKSANFRATGIFSSLLIKHDGLLLQIRIILYNSFTAILF